MPEKKFPWTIKRGYPVPSGVTVLNEGINFALFSRHATQVTLVIDLPDPKTKRPVRYEFALDREENRTGDIWHALLVTTNTDFSYGYRVFGPKDIPGCVFTPDKILIDPYSHALTPRSWGEDSHYGNAPCCQIPHHDFDWQHDRPLKTPLSETVIYEMHVRGFTQQAKDVTAPGTYSAVIEKIPYLKQLGVTAVELLPVTEFDENDNIFFDPQSGKRLKNFWGYNPISFFALKSGYASDPANHINEFKTMVRALHRAGIEVILDIVYNHTGEGGYQGITSSFRGIDNPIYYLLDPNSEEYLNFSGCGNTFNCNHPVARSLIRESLRYWVMEMHVDGFRFDLASILGRDQSGNVLANPPMIELIAEDPVLRDTKIIAEAWDAAGLYQVGSFSSSSRWGEWNGRFRDDIRAFMAGHNGMVAKVATRLAGSSDLYQASGRGPLSSINFITSHDGFTLHDLVSYDTKHNENNGEDNRDGDNHNLSWNSGVEGSKGTMAIRKLRSRRIRSMATLLFLSQGVPMLTAGDELGRSQEGNNNAWCQDNETSWLDWRLMHTNQDLLRFFRQLIDLRQKHPVFRRQEFFSSVETISGKILEEISWQYLQPGISNWDENCHGLGALLHGKSEQGRFDDDFFLMLNGSRHESLNFTLPEVPQNSDNRSWRLTIDCAASSPNDISLHPVHSDTPLGSSLVVEPMTVKLLQSVPQRLKTPSYSRD